MPESTALWGTYGCASGDPSLSLSLPLHFMSSLQLYYRNKGKKGCSIVATDLCNNETWRNSHWTNVWTNLSCQSILKIWFTWMNKNSSESEKKNKFGVRKMFHVFCKQSHMFVGTDAIVGSALTCGTDNTSLSPGSRSFLIPPPSLSHFTSCSLYNCPNRNKDQK